MPECDEANLKVIITRGYRYAFALSNDPSQAEDLLQEAFLKVLKANRALDVAYLFVTIRNHFIDTKRREGLAVFEHLDEEQRAENEACWIVDRSFSKGDLQSSLNSLRSIEREVIYLCAVEGYGAAEVGEMLGYPRGTISSLLTRARSKLTHLLNQKALKAS